MKTKINAIIPAGGNSSRFGNTNKLLEKINNKEVIKYTIDAFNESNVDEIIVCSNISIIDELKTYSINTELLNSERINYLSWHRNKYEEKKRAS